MGHNKILQEIVTVRNEKVKLAAGLAQTATQINQLSTFTAENRKDQEANAFRMQQRNKKLKKSADARANVADALREKLDAKMNLNMEVMKLQSEIQKLVVRIDKNRITKKDVAQAKARAYKITLRLTALKK